MNELNYGDIVKLPKQGKGITCIYLGENYRGFIKYNKILGYFEFESKKQHIFLNINNEEESILNKYKLTYKTGNDLGTYKVIGFNDKYSKDLEFAWAHINGSNIEAVASTMKNIVRSEGTTEAFKLKHPLKDLVKVYCTLVSLSDNKIQSLNMYRDLYNAFGRYISLEGSY